MLILSSALKTLRKIIISYKQLNLLIQNFVHICSKGRITCLFDLTAFSCCDDFNVGLESLTYIHHIFCIDILLYSVCKVFEEVCSYVIRASMVNHRQYQDPIIMQWLQNIIDATPRTSRKNNLQQ